MAFERSEGPIGPEWQNENRAAQHEQLQRLNHIQGAAHFKSKTRKNPVPEPKHYPRPWELHRKDDKDPYDAEEDQLNTDLMDEEDSGDGDGH